MSSALVGHKAKRPGRWQVSGMNDLSDRLLPLKAAASKPSTFERNFTLLRRP
jgi:hypothetical protein